MAAPLDALRAEADRTAELLATLGPEAWSRPTRCPPLDVLALAAHAWRGSGRIREMIAAGPVDAEPEEDAVTYFQYDVAAVSPEVVVRAQAVAAEQDPATFPAVWRRGWAGALDEAAAVLRHDDPVLRGVSGLIRLSEFLRTRVVEVTIHTMDLRGALGLDPDPAPEGLAGTCDVLRGLLGADLRPLGVDEVRFALAGTGREKLTAAERELLGPLAERFPLLQ